MTKKIVLTNSLRMNKAKAVEWIFRVLVLTCLKLLPDFNRKCLMLNTANIKVTPETISRNPTEKIEVISA